MLQIGFAGQQIIVDLNVAIMNARCLTGGSFCHRPATVDHAKTADGRAHHHIAMREWFFTITHANVKGS